MYMCMCQKSTALIIVRYLLSPATATVFLVSVPVSVPVCVLFSPTALQNVILLHRNIDIIPSHYYIVISFYHHNVKLSYYDIIISLGSG